VRDSEEIDTQLRQLLDTAPPAVIAAYMFGSIARGTAGPRSDVDLAMLLSAPPPPTLEGRLFDYEAELERTLRAPVQIVVLNHAPPDLIHRVLRDGRLLLDRDASARIQFEVKSRNEYFDLLPFLRRYRAEPAARRT
jgi:predicted nucleotidyltransferase